MSDFGLRDCAVKAFIITISCLSVCLSVTSFYISLKTAFHQGMDGKLNETEHTRGTQFIPAPKSSRLTEGMERGKPHPTVAHVFLLPPGGHASSPSSASSATSASSGGALPENILSIRRQGHTVIHSGTSVKETSVHIRKSGFYYIYSQVTFVHYGRGNEKLSPVAQFVFRHNKILPNDGNEQLLRYSRTVETQNSGFTEHTSFTAGTFYLRANDEIFVNVSDVTSVSHSAGASYLGLYSV